MAYAGEVLRVERDVAVKGKLTAGERVIVESAETGKETAAGGSTNS